MLLHNQVTTKDSKIPGVGKYVRYYCSDYCFLVKMECNYVDAIPHKDFSSMITTDQVKLRMPAASWSGLVIRTYIHLTSLAGTMLDALLPQSVNVFRSPNFLFHFLPKSMKWKLVLVLTPATPKLLL